MAAAQQPLRFRPSPRTGDIATVRSLLAATGMFTPAEVRVGVELVAEGVRSDGACDYRFLFAELSGDMVGYTCYGPIACTHARFDLYWIVVQPSWQGKGIGGLLLAKTEELVRAEAGRRIYIETSSQPRYGPTRAFYGSRGYREAARVDGFYDDRDAKVIFVKVL